eukprot:TRINITY_DN14698_c0_g1_i1.p1 TRINITY_DN14698_c0_g1~~TRINITY_DN14698_c0_g1_i1.p1  ORF type:complete len:961 (+),score=323.32 TRINITY_DN14698_c0_g1_i1:61-2883(+)
MRAAALLSLCPVAAVAAGCRSWRSPSGCPGHADLSCNETVPAAALTDCGSAGACECGGGRLVPASVQAACESVCAEVCGCNVTGRWEYHGGAGEEQYTVAESADGSFSAKRTSSAGSWHTASGSVSDSCSISVKFDSGAKDTGSADASCSVLRFKDGSQWARVGQTACSELKGPGAAVVVGAGVVTIGNGYTCAVVDTARPSLSGLYADFGGQGAYGSNVLSGDGVTLERESGDGSVTSSVDAGPANVTVLGNASALASVRVALADAAGADAAAAEVWTLSLAGGARSVVFESSGRTTRDVSAKAIRHTFRFLPTSIYALFSRGVVQMKERTGSHWYGSSDTLPRLYALGGSGGEGNTAGNMSVAVTRGGGAAAVVLWSDDKAPFSGLQEVLAGSPPSPADTWSDWGSAKASTIPAGTKWQLTTRIAPNNRDFPAQGPAGDVTAKANIPDADLQALLTGVYASPVGQLCTHDNGVAKGKRVGQMATTIARPSYGYSDNYNFFDPDNYISTAALLYSGDSYLQQQVRTVLERNGDFINDKGQLPHHFRGVEPQYQALSGETQTGPNVFWILSCFNYAKVTGDLGWLSGYMPKLRTASAFLYDMINPAFGLLNAPGSLMIDVFLRSNFTTDTNAMVVGFFREFAAAEAAVGNSTGAAALQRLADGIAERVDSMLWNNASDDHYVTQLNPDGTSRDFVDYDANLIALAHGIAPPDRAAATLKRIDGGRCAHGRATFVSERYYGKDDTTAGNIGDSWCSMGRIGWFDALSRKRYGDQKAFDGLILDPLVGDVNRWTWLHERYQCDGQPEINRTAMYFEYPSVTAMMLHYLRYGIQMHFQNVTVSPFGPASFSYHVGAFSLEYSQASVSMAVAGTGKKHVRVDGMAAGASYSVTVDAGPRVDPWPAQGCGAKESSTAVASSAGVLEFQATVGDSAGPCVISAKLQ